MTINIEDLKRDRDAGTDGPWWTDGKYSVDECGVAIIAARTDCGPMPGNPTRGMAAWASEILPENADRCEANARRIARLPELEAAFLDAVELLEQWNTWACGQTGYSPFRDASDFLEKIK